MAQPYTVQFGPWSPDLSNVAVQMPNQWGATPLPCADCLNVYYQDGNYRVLPGLNTIGPSLGTQIQAAFTWYDDTADEEIVFAATSNGISALADNMWSTVLLSTGITTIVSTGLVLGTGGLGFGLVQSGQANSLGTRATMGLGKSTVLGQILNGILVAGRGFDYVGYQTQSSGLPQAGSLTPSTDIHGNLVTNISYTNLEVLGGTTSFTAVSINAPNLGQSYFSALVVPALGVNLASSAALYASTATASSWTFFATAVNFVPGTEYNVSLLP